VVGDAVLCEAARRMRSAVRTYDCVGRYGGEEFLFILPGCDTDSAKTQAERIRTRITAQPVQVGRLTIPFTVSIGAVVRYRPVVEDLDNLIQAADAALYDAKMQGRDRVVLAEVPEAALNPPPPPLPASPRA
jgi:diguanylate cyclase (GGDEF)-like protein